MQLSISKNDFLNSFKNILSDFIDKYERKKIDLFILNLNANCFDYSLLKERLVDPMINFSISRKVIAKYSDKPGALSKKARSKYVNHTRNTGELGELLLYCFLETHLNAPKILSKLELKTTTSKYSNGSDGIHYKKVNENTFQLIFGESKTIKNLTAAIADAFKSIYEFKNEINDKGEKKSGISYEKSLISDCLEKETFSEEEKNFIENIIYPKEDSNFVVDDAFAIFIGYEIQVADEDKAMKRDDFEKNIYRRISSEIKSKFDLLRKHITNYNLSGHDLYIYILPFTHLEQSRKEIQEYIQT